MKKTGFTLIELLLVIAITAVMLLAISTVLAAILGARVKHQTIVEIEEQGLVAMTILTQTIRNATAINSPAVGGVTGALSLNVLESSHNPTIFDTASGTLRVTEGSGSAVELTNTQVTVNNLTFSNLSQASTPGTIRVQFTLSHVNPSGRNEYDYSQTFYATATLR